MTLKTIYNNNRINIYRATDELKNHLSKKLYSPYTYQLSRIQETTPSLSNRL